MRILFDPATAVPRTLDMARRELRAARRYRTLRRSSSAAARLAALLAVFVDACIGRLRPRAPRVVVAGR